MDLELMRQSIDEEINILAVDFRETPGLILSEGDLQFHLAHRLLEIPELSEKSETNDSDEKSSALHTEISWFDDTQHLRIKPDISIIDPRYLNLYYSPQFKVQLPSKGFHYIGPSILFELKLIRNKHGMTKRDFDQIEKDFDKISRLFNYLNDAGYSNLMFCYFIIFSKGSRKHPEFNTFINKCQLQNLAKVIHITGAD